MDRIRLIVLVALLGLVLLLMPLLLWASAPSSGAYAADLPTAIEPAAPARPAPELASGAMLSPFLSGSEAKASAQNPIVRLDPQNSIISVGDSFTVTVMVDDAADLGCFQFDLVYDPSVVWVDGVTLGDCLESTGRPVVSLGPEVDNEAGKATFGAFSFGDQPGPDGSGALALVRLRAVGVGSGLLDLQDVMLTDTKVNSQTPTIEDGTVTVSWTPTSTPTATPTPTHTPTPTPTYTPTPTSTPCVLFGDLDGDGDVDVDDIMEVASRWRTSCDNLDPDNNPATPNYEARFDIDEDCDIDIVDIMMVVAHWGETCP